MELQLLVPSELGVMYPYDVVEAAGCENVVKLRVPFEAENAGACTL